MYSTCARRVVVLRRLLTCTHNKHPATASQAKGQYHHHRRLARPLKAPQSIPSYPPTKLEAKTIAIHTPVKPYSILGLSEVKSPHTLSLDLSPSPVVFYTTCVM